MTRALPALFALTLAVAAALLFSVQPMIARTALPLLGGSPAVWTTCVLFFQAVLLAGYAYAHASASRLGLPGQVALHAAVLGSAFLFLPIAAPPSGITFSPGADPTAALLAWLLRSAGVPFFAVAATAPLLQGWFSRTRHSSARDPYYLYAASNAGSLLALLAYPLWVERKLRLGSQSATWSSGLWVLAGLSACCGTAAIVSTRARAEFERDVRVDEPAAPADWLVWVALALVPSSLMLGLTTYLSTDLAAIPLLWVVPLGLYLLSFILVFGRAGGWFRKWAFRGLPIVVIALAPVLGVGLVQPYWIPLHVLAFFAAALVCHGELSRRRPGASRLTTYYLAMSAGGALGGLFNAVIAPVVFDRVAEYPLALVAACLVPAFREGARGVGKSVRADLVLPVVVGAIVAALCADVGGLAETGLGVAATVLAAGLTTLAFARHGSRPVRFALTVGALWLAGSLAGGVTGRVIHRERSFFGVLKVTQAPGRNVHRLFHGSTLHGQQDLDPGRRREPSTYFDRTGPVGDLFAVFQAGGVRQSARVAVTGVGAGSLACYARPGQRWTYYEIDPAVVRVARDVRYFTYLADCAAASLDVIVGDARLSMARATDGGFDLIILDAFSSDAIPVHLLTREALSLYRRKLAPGGLIAVNISNRYLDLAPVVARLAQADSLACRVRTDATISPGQKATGKQGSIWAVMAARPRDLGEIATDPRWLTPTATPGEEVWTDDFSDVLGHFRIFGRAAATPRS